MNERQIKLCDILLEQDNYITAKELAKKLKVTPKTIYLDARKIEDNFVELELYIDRKPNQGLKMIGILEERQKLKKMLHISSEQTEDSLGLDARRQHIFKEMLIEGRSLSLQEFSEQYYVSKTAIMNDLDYFTRFLAPMNVRFTTINKKIEVVGEESDIQSAMVNYLRELSTNGKRHKEEILESYFGISVYQSLKHLYIEGNLIDFSGMNDYYEESLFLNLLVFVSRVLEGKHCKGENILDFHEASKECFPLACDLCSLISQRIDVSFESNDIDMVSRLLFAHKAFPVKLDNQSWGSIVDEIIDRLEQTEDIVLDDTSELRRQLLSHLPAMILRLNKGVKIINPLLQEIKTRHLPLFTASWYILSTLENKYKIVLNDDEVAFITIFFQMAINKTIPSHKILVVCPYGAASSQFVVRKLRQMLPKNDDIISSGASKLTQMSLQDIDLIVTTAPIRVQTIVPIVQVSPLLGDEDYAKIFDAYAKNIFLKKNRLLESLRLHQLELPSLKKYVRGNDLFFKQNFSSKEECLNFMIDHFESMGYVKEGFRQSVFEREKMGSTGLDNNVALPHAKPELCNEVAIGIVTLRKPVKWTKGYYVDMIVLLSVPQQMENEFGNIVLDIYHLIENGSIVAELKKLEQGDDLISILHQK